MPLESPIRPSEPLSDGETPQASTSPHEALRTALGKSGLHYTDFAPFILGCSPSSVWRWMQGQHIPDCINTRVLLYLAGEETKEETISRTKEVIRQLKEGK